MTEPDCFDVVMHGTVFFDIVLTGMARLPSTGTEVFAEGMGSCPGGIANLAVAASRLGLRTSLAAVFGDDVYGDFLWRTLAEQEQVDLSLSRRIAEWHSPVTVSLAVARDRAMVTHSHPSPVTADELMAGIPPASAGVVHLGEPARASGDSDATQATQAWVERAAGDGMKLFGDVGWDPTQQWSPSLLEQLGDLYAFLPNSVEAMGYTRTDDPRAALHALADSVPVVVVTCGGQGSIGIDSTTGEEEWVPSLPVNAVDSTGAGDVFAAAFVLGTLRGWRLRERMAFANLCAALSVQQVGGSLAAPGWGDIADWLSETARRGRLGSAPDRRLHADYRFLAEALPAEPHREVRRAIATIARSSDA